MLAARKGAMATLLMAGRGISVLYSLPKALSRRRSQLHPTLRPVALLTRHIITKQDQTSSRVSSSSAAYLYYSNFFFNNTRSNINRWSSTSSNRICTPEQHEYISIATALSAKSASGLRSANNSSSSSNNKNSKNNNSSSNNNNNNKNNNNNRTKNNSSSNNNNNAKSNNGGSGVNNNNSSSKQSRNSSPSSSSSSRTSSSGSGSIIPSNRQTRGASNSPPQNGATRSLTRSPGTAIGRPAGLRTAWGTNASTGNGGRGVGQASVIGGVNGAARGLHGGKPRQPETLEIPEDKIDISFTRSSGAGGQSVNKLSTKVEMRFVVTEAEWLPHDVRIRLTRQEKGRINKEGEIIITAQDFRTQKQNRKEALHKLREMINQAWEPPKERKMRTGISKVGKEIRRADKLHRSKVKFGRSKLSSRDDD